MSATPRIVLRRTQRGAALVMLFSVTKTENNWTAEGYYAPSVIRAGSVVKFEGHKIRLPRLESGYFKKQITVEVVNGEEL